MVYQYSTFDGSLVGAFSVVEMMLFLSNSLVISFACWEQLASYHCQPILRSTNYSCLHIWSYMPNVTCTKAQATRRQLLQKNQGRQLNSLVQVVGSDVCPSPVQRTGEVDARFCGLGEALSPLLDLASDVRRLWIWL